MNLGGIVKNNPFLLNLGFWAFPLLRTESPFRHSQSALEFSIILGEYPTAEVHLGEGRKFFWEGDEIWVDHA